MLKQMLNPMLNPMLKPMSDPGSGQKPGSLLEPFVAVDLEMTGLKAGRDRILEIGAAKIADHQVAETYQCLVNPHRKLEDNVVALTGITQNMADRGREEEEAVRNFLEFCGDLPIAGHNVICDYSFLKQSVVNHGILAETSPHGRADGKEMSSPRRQAGGCFEPKAYDTLKLARKLLPGPEKKTLDELCIRFGIIRTRQHRALEDAEAAAGLLLKLWEEYHETFPELFVPKPLVRRVKKQGPASPGQKKYLKELADYHKIDLPMELEGMTKNEASRLTDRILSRYGRMAGRSAKNV